MNKVRQILANKKTYLACAATILGAVIAYAEGAIEISALLQTVVTAIIGMTLRAGIAKNNPK